MNRDDRPMLPMHENGIALYRTYRCLGVRPGSEFAPWQIALLDWWHFIGRREATILAREQGRAAPQSSEANPTNQDHRRKP